MAQKQTTLLPNSNWLPQSSLQFPLKYPEFQDISFQPWMTPFWEPEITLFSGCQFGIMKDTFLETWSFRE